MASHAFVSGCHALRDALAYVDRLGGNDVVKAVKLYTQPNYIPLSTRSSCCWPIIIEVAPMHPYTAINEIRVRNLRVGITCETDLEMKLGRSELDADELLKSLGFDIPDLFVRTFKGERFEKTELASA